MKRYSGVANLKSNPFAVDSSAHFESHQDLIHEAVVVDVIVNDSHPEYATDGYNVGAIQFRALKRDQYKDKEKLNWALPIESNITDYPLLNEIVMIHVTLNRMYYSRKLNVTSRVTNQAVIGLNVEISEEIGQKERISDLRNSKVNPRVEKATPPDKLGKFFTEKPGVFRLRADEGDILYEGRSGHSIRFGAAWSKGTNFQSTKTEQAPNLLMRVGPDTSQTPSVPGKFGLVTEDINKDGSSIWMVFDQLVPLAFSTKASKVHTKSIVDFPKRLDGNQIVINTDRFVVNTKTDKILGFSAKGIHWTTLGDFTIDSDRDFVSTLTQDLKWDIGRDCTVKVAKIFDATAGTRYSIVSPKVFIGVREDSSEPVPCGATLADFLQQFLNIITSTAAVHVQTTGTPGSPSALNPAIVAQLKSLQQDVAKGAKASFNSTVAYTTK